LPEQRRLITLAVICILAGLILLIRSSRTPTIDTVEGGPTTSTVEAVDWSGVAAPPHTPEHPVEEDKPFECEMLYDCDCYKTYNPPERALKGECGEESMRVVCNCFGWRCRKPGLTLNATETTTTLILKPDALRVEVSNLTLDPDKPRTGESIRTHYTIKNYGNRSASDIQVMLYVNHILVESETIHRLKPGQRQSSKFNYTWNVTKGTHNLEVLALSEEWSSISSIKITLR
jgi:hypothetical protein